MFERFERPLKILCLGLAALLVWQVAGLILRGDPLARLKIPALPTLPGVTNEAIKLAPKQTNAAPTKKSGTNSANAIVDTNKVHSTNLVQATNLPAKLTNGRTMGEGGTTNAVTNTAGGPKRGGARKPGLPPGVTPEMLASLPPEVAARMMGGGMPGGRGAGPKMELPPQVQARVDKIIDSEILGPAFRPVPAALIGISDQEAFIQATNGQIGSVKIGGELGGLKLLRIGLNRVLVEQDGEKKELTIFGGAGGESLLPKETNSPSTHVLSANAPTNKASIRRMAGGRASTNQTLSPKQKETP